MGTDKPRRRRPQPPRGRLAPSPTGKVHIGNARTALLAWLSVRSRGGSLVWRLEDLDPPRIVPGLDRQAEDDLKWLGLDWDEGPAEGGKFPPYEQSGRSEFYVRALRHLASERRVFPCSISRKDLREIASAPHATTTLSPYPLEFRPTLRENDWLDTLLHDDDTDSAVRFLTRDESTEFEDRVCGTQRQNVEQEVGDFVLRRRDGLWAYQLAVVVDDIEMEIDDVVRGNDLLDSTARQIQLLEALGAVRPDYAHVSLMINEAGDKLSKRDDGLSVESVRRAGATAEQLTGYLAWSVGLQADPRPQHPAQLIESFDWSRIRNENFAVPRDAPHIIANLA